MIKITKEEEKCGECGKTKRRAEYDTFCDYCEALIPDDDEKSPLSASYMIDDGRTHETDTDNYKRLTFCCTECYRDWVINFKDNLPDNFSYFSVAMPHLETKEEFEEYIGVFK